MRSKEDSMRPLVFGSFVVLVAALLPRVAAAQGLGAQVAALKKQVSALAAQVKSLQLALKKIHGFKKEGSDYVFSAPGKVVLRGSDVSLEGASKVTAKAGTSMGLRAGGAFDVKAGAAASLVAGGKLDLKGATILLNGGGRPASGVRHQVSTPAGTGGITEGSPSVLIP
jgi:hypothetical protein